MQRKRFWRATGIGCIAAVVLGLAYAAHSWLLGEEGKPVLWSSVLADWMSFWGVWGLLAGVVDYLVRRFPIGRRSRRNILIHLAAAAIASPLHSTVCHLAMKNMSPHFGHVAWDPGKSLGTMILYAYPRGMVYFLLTVAIVHALNYYHRYEERARAASELEAQLANTKLHLLKAQLHPHFLFNTLNSISALLHQDVELADLMIERLGDFLRLTLDHSVAQEVTLREEMDFLQCYLSIEQIRLQERLTSRIHIDPQTLDARVPSLILQPLVENAIRHGIAPRTEPGRIEIEARRRRSSLFLTVRDDGPGLSPGAGGRGMGLQITRARLERLYGARQRFDLVNAPEGGLLATLEIPYTSSIEDEREHDTRTDRG